MGSAGEGCILESGLSSPIPSAEEQLKFLHKIQRLLDEGQFTSTYKFALLIALADLSVEKSDGYGGELILNSREIAEKFIQLYWRQVIPFPAMKGEGGVLFQNTDRQAAIINRITIDHSQTAGGLMSLMGNRAEYRKLVTDVAGTVRDMPLWRLQRIGNQMDDFLYENTGKGGQITLRPGVAYCMRQFHGQIIAMVQGVWVQWMRKIRKNQQLLGQSTDLADFLFGSERNALSSYLPVLQETQGNSCFYCRQEIKGAGEVDHFIPWSRYPVDLGHNFVLAHKSCNGSKGNVLADVPHLEHWQERNEKYGDALVDFFDEHDLVHDLPSSNAIVSWAYEQAEHAGAHLWSSKNESLVIMNYGLSDMS